MRKQWVWLVWLIVLVFGLTACAPSNTATASVPTLAVLPTDIPIPSATPLPPVLPTLPPTFTPIPSNTPAPTATRRPSQTPAPDTTEADCFDLMQVASEALVGLCGNMPRGEACYGSALVTADVFTSDDVRLMRGPGSLAPLSAIINLNTSAMDVEGAIWGTSFLRLTDDAIGAMPDDASLNVLLMGGVTVENLVPSLTLQIQNREAQPANNRTPIEPPLIRSKIRSDNAPAACPFVPNGVMLQAPRLSRLSINGTDIEFDGTIYVTGQANGEMTITTLEGITRWQVGSNLRDVPVGVTASIALDRDLLPANPNPPQVRSIDIQLQRGLFEGANNALTVLARPVESPNYIPPEQLALYTSYTGEWRVAMDIKQLAGVYSAGTPLTDGLYQQAQDICPWEGVSLLGQTVEQNAVINLTNADQNMFMTTTYPGVQFPTVWERVAGQTNQYRGEFISADGGRYIHTLAFQSMTDFTWRVEMSNITPNFCSSGIVEGIGTRISAPTPTPNASIAGGTTAQTWQVILTAGGFSVPSSQVIADCSTAASYQPPLVQTLINTSIDPNTNTLTLQTAIPDFPLPPLFTATAADPNTYLAEVTRDNIRYVQTIRVGTNDVAWRVMVHSLDSNCRLGSFEAVGAPF